MLAVKKARPPKIGSIRNDKINYDKEEQFFSKEDVPFHAKTIKEEIKQLVDPDHLGLRKKDWNASVSVPKNFEKEETHEQKLLKVKAQSPRSNWALLIIQSQKAATLSSTQALTPETIILTGMWALKSGTKKSGPIYTNRNIDPT